ncbi:sulfotransferase family protein [Novosphingobium piscinae]|uniref:Sulfotransferase n=1 Tax=Novosphingobium piscinae TaxID=1507448 RepID=A0A7X1KNI9_9SPHN|nr:sulfotransferase [Novosphingobium piscinae]MBC2667739.1 sulfotransferase [Novosphingobium piscinae]
MIDPEALLAAAREQTGLSDFGDPSFREGLDVLVRALNTEAGLSEAGAGRVAGSITATLAQRLRVEDYLKTHPELLEAPIEQPTFVFGLPRTGTTLAINLLAADPTRRVFMRWEAFNTVPPAAPGELRTDPRCLAEQARLDGSKQYLPHIAAMHWENADSSTECQFAMTPSFCSQVYESQYHVPSYSDWFHRADYVPAFRYHKRLMQLLQGTNGGQWTFKNPWHPLYLDALTTVYPDAQLIMTHRDPADVVASACSLIFAVRKMFSDSVDPVACGRAQLRTFDLMIARVRAFEDKHGRDAIHHIAYQGLVSDPIGEMRKAYARFDKPFTEETRAVMQAVLDENPQGKHGKHEYRLEDYGLSRAEVYDHFADYIARYAIPTRA